MESVTGIKVNSVLPTPEEADIAWEEYEQQVQAAHQQAGGVAIGREMRILPRLDKKATHFINNKIICSVSDLVYKDQMVSKSIDI